MSIAESFYTFLSGNGTITALLASSDSIYPHLMPQRHDGYPAITYSLSNDEEIYLLNGGKSATATALLECRIWDTRFKTCNDIAQTVKGELIGYRGAFGSHTADYIRKDEGGEISLAEEPDTGLHSVRLMFEIRYY